MTPVVALLRLAVRCTCGRMPPLRITEAERELAGTQPQTHLKGTWSCKCGRVHPITAQAYIDAA